ncbi:MAG: low temperature requirement protein A [Pseudomonadota bacterium]
MATRHNLLRTREGHTRVTYVELFFDLVFVFAVTQLSHTLLEHLTLAGGLQTLFLLLAVWWVWIYTCWFTNWIDPEKPAVRMMMFALMLAGLMLSASIPNAFGSEGLLFAIAYAFMQMARTAFLVHALHKRDAANFANMRRVFIWLAVSALFWIAGGCLAAEQRVLLWLLALGIEYLGPVAYFYVPGLGRSSTADWKIDGAHMAERCALFVIIALGESILVTGATAASLPATNPAVCAFIVAFLGSVAMWWIYFNIGAERGSREFAGAKDPGRMARNVYTYFHIPIVAGIVVCAVADEITIAHPMGHLTPGAAAALLGGPALYLAGNIYFKRASAKYYPLSHLAGLGLLALVAAISPTLEHVTPLALGTATTVILVIVALWETLSFRK